MKATLQGLDLAQAAAGQDQQPEGCDNERGFRPVGFGLGHNHAKPLQLMLAQESLALLLAVFRHMAAGVGPVRAQALELGQVEHLRRQAKRVVRLIRARAARLLIFWASSRLQQIRQWRKRPLWPGERCAR